MVKIRIKEKKNCTYAFVNPVVSRKVDMWKNYIKEMNRLRSKERIEFRRKAGLTVERDWIQHTPVGDFAIVYWEAKDISNVFDRLMKAEAQFDKWFRDKVLVEVHVMDLSKPPPMNELLLDFKT